MNDTYNRNKLQGEFGQRPTPKAGSAIKQIVIRDEDHNGYFDRIKDRFIWMPYMDINFSGRMAEQPMSFDYVYRGRTAWVQPVSYKALNNSIEVWDAPGDDEQPLKTFVLTPFAQCVFLHLNYAERGLVVFEHLKAQTPELVAHIEATILPEVPDNLIELGDVLMRDGQKNIEEAGFDSATKELAVRTLASMITGTHQAIKYARHLVDESEGEILTRRNKGVGKASLDRNDRFAYHMLNREVPTESQMAGAPEKKQNELLQQLVAAIKGSKVVEADDEKDIEIAVLKTQLSDLSAKFDQFLQLANLPTPGVTARIEDSANVAPEVVQEDIKRRMEEKNRNNKR